ncbi:sigma-70 family RNA polymerase sigma factor [Roseomonas sp. BN140053]|uniref:sigma-70 family RNA polymerase sigma factor n=1 Tax=Roseomonas sp. BN140053 TaxID=3391898 RepID=UPI0039E8900E
MPRVPATDRLERNRAEAADEVLVAWSVAGDRLAFDQLAARHLPRLYGLALRITGTAAEAEEVAQDAMLRAWENAARFDPARASFGTWVFRIASNLAIDRVRSRGSRPAAPLEEAAALADPEPGPEEQLSARQQRGRMAAALAELPARQRAALALFYDQGLSGSEAASALSVSVRGLEGLLRRARRCLAARLRGPEGEQDGWA